MNQPLMAPDIPVDLSNCDLEPIHIPSLIQPHGMLLAARKSDLRVVYASANSTALIGVTPAYILERTLIDILGAEAVEAIEAALGEETYLPRDIRAFTFPISGDLRFDVTAHRSHGLLCVELEVALEPSRWDLLATNLETAMQTLGTKSLQQLYEAVPPLVRGLAGYDRVMVYKFDADGHGEVVGEDKATEMEPFLGLHYPATDIPRQARKLYLQQRFRTIVDVNYLPVPVLANRELMQDEPLDMTFCSLRSTSPIHIEYLQNMGVGATLAISVIVSGQLWGLIVGHHRTSKHLTPESRALCDLLGQLISLLIDVAEQANVAADYRQKRSWLDLLNASMEEDLLADNGLVSSAQTLLDLVRADGAVVRLGGRLTLLGNTPKLNESTALLDAFQARLHDQNTLATNTVGGLFPAFAHLVSQASGALLLPFHEPFEGLLWLRGEITQTVRWAGKPDASKQYFEGSIRLSPRKSFALWEQVQHGRSLPWLPSEIEAALGVQRIAVRALLLRSETRLLQFQRTDLLTGLGNRVEILRQKSLWRAREPQPVAALLFIDIDEFRAINDRYGHSLGDEFLRQFGARLVLLDEGKHFVARLGGDEFAIFCEDTTVARAEQLATLILEGLSEPFDIFGRTLSSTASIGIAPVQWVNDTRVSDPLRVADSAMYVAKHKGGNQYSIVESREQAEILRATIADEVIARRIAAYELKTSHARFNSVLEATSDSVIAIGHDWTMLYANHRAAADLPDFRIGANYWACFPSVIGTPSETALRTTMVQRTEQSYEIFFVPYQRWFRAKAFPVAEGISVFFSDFTEQKNIEEQLKLEQILREKRIEALTHMAAGLAHEISNPLAIIHALASDLVQLAQAHRPVDPHEVRSACENILKTANRASNILRGLRGFAREAGQDPMEPASIYEIVDLCIELQQHRFERHHVQITIAMAPGIPQFLCREVQVGQIITNLLNNAFDAITQSDVIERWISLTVKFSADHICVDVSDSGPGIEDHFRDHLMEPFFTTKEHGLGMGVGLSLSRAIAQDHNGTLTLVQDTQHTTFRLVLRMAQEAETAITSPWLSEVYE